MSCWEGRQLNVWFWEALMNVLLLIRRRLVRNHLCPAANPNTFSSITALYGCWITTVYLRFPPQTLTTLMPVAQSSWIPVSVLIRLLVESYLGSGLQPALEFCSCTDRLALMYPHNFMACTDPYYSLKLSNLAPGPPWSVFYFQW